MLSTERTVRRFTPGIGRNLSDYDESEHRYFKDLNLIISSIYFSPEYGLQISFRIEQRDMSDWSIERVHDDPVRTMRREIFRAGLLLFSLGLLGACDSSVSTGPPEREEASDSPTVQYAHMPTGASLPTPGQRPPGTLQSYRKGRQSKGGSVESPYGCYLASRPYSEEVRFRSVYLYFPDEVIASAHEETERLLFRLDAVRRGKTDTTGVRYAHCVIPNAEGARSAARQQVIRKGEEQAVKEAVQSADQATARKSDCNEIVQVVEYCDYGGCTVVSVVVTEVCGGGDGGGDAGDGGDGGSGSGGSGEDTTDPYPDDDRAGGGGRDDSGGGTGEECTEIDPEPGSECEPSDPEPDVNEQKLCPSDPLKDMDIRATCAGREGGRFGENARGTGDPHYGVDLLAEVGTPAWALTSGRVYAVNRQPNVSDFGRYVIIRSDDNLIMYAHLSKVSVNSSENVVGGKTKIGETGVTGNACRSSCSCGPSHLHLGVKEGNTWGSGTPRDPEQKVLGTEFDSNGDPILDNCG